jgi:hypothetical protein
MSIVITVVSKNAIVQVSDLRLSSLKDGEPLPQLQRKSMLILGRHAAFVLGWAGFAKTDDDRFNTGDWLFRALNHINAVELPLADIAGNLTGEATHAFDGLRVPQKNKGCRFLLGGWQRTAGNAELFTGVIFNDLSHNSQPQYGESVWSESSTVDTKFMYAVASFGPVEFPYNVQAIGSVKKPEKIRHQMRVLKKVMDNRGEAAAIVRACVDVAREAARHTRTIGEDLIVLSLEKNGRKRCVFLSKEDGEEALVPDVISLSGSTTQGTIRTIFSGDSVSFKFRAKGLKR